MLWALSACTAPPDGLPAGRVHGDPASAVLSTDEPSAGVTPPVLVEIGPLAPGLDAIARVSTLLPLENAYVAWSTEGEGEGPCPDRLGGACLDLVDPGPLVGPGAADRSYSASIAIPWTLDHGPVRVQAIAFRLDGTVATTPVVTRPVYDRASVLAGDAVLSSDADVAALAGIRAITGSLTVDGLASVSLPDLEQIGGDLVAWEDDRLSTLSLPRLARVGGDVSLYADPALTSLSGLAALESIGGTLSLNRLDGLVDLDPLVRLERIGDTLYAFHDVNLVRIELPALRETGGAVEVWEDYALERLSLPALEVLGTKLDLFEDVALGRLDLPVVSRMGSYELHHCDAMTGVGRFPALADLPGELDLEYDPALVDVSGLGSLASIGEAKIRYNPKLSECAIDDLFARVDAGPVSCVGNLDDGCAGVCSLDTGP